MKKAMVMLFLVIISFPIFADVSVKGYYQKDGTYVQPHHRSNPDSNTYNNWSTQGNTNPYTGKEGSQNPQRNNNWGNYR